MKPYGVIYFILNKINGKYYIGQTIRKVSVRWNKHIYDSHRASSIKGCRDNYFYRSIRKYSSNSFEVRTLLTVYSKEDLDSAETYYIDFFQSRTPEFGYNSKTGGAVGVPNDATRQRMSMSHKGKPSPQKGTKRGPRTLESRKRQSAAQTGKKKKPMSAQGRSNISSGQKGREAPNKGKPGKPCSEEQKLLISNALTGRTKSPEHIASAVEGRKKVGYGHSPETRKLLSDIQKGKPKGPQTPEHIANVAKGKAAAKARREEEAKQKGPRPKSES